MKTRAEASAGTRLRMMSSDGKYAVTKRGWSRPIASNMVWDATSSMPLMSPLALAKTGSWPTESSAPSCRVSAVHQLTAAAVTPRAAKISHT